MSPFRQFERPHFFSGKLLTADDFQREQDYHRGKARLRNRFLHGWGIVVGLSVSIDQGEVVVAPGIAMDCAGNELVLPDPVRIPVTSLNGRRFVTLRYVELPIGGVPSQNGQNEASGVREAVQVELSATNPQAGHGAFPAGGPGCGQAHALCLAAISPRGARWRVIPGKRPVPRRR